MKSFTRFGVLSIMLGLVAAAAVAKPLNPMFTYQSQLKNEGAPLNGIVDLNLTFWDSEFAGTGLFSVQVQVPDALFTDDMRWLEIGVRYPADTGAWILLSPRELVAAVPNAAFAFSDSNGQR
ncbi:MAG: hypothetical protein ACYTHJ_04270 [Planctomycetota bacterium]